MENFGLAKSAATQIKLQLRPNGREPVTVTAPLSPLEPYASADVILRVPAELTPAGETPKVDIIIEGEPAENALKVSLPKLP